MRSLVSAHNELLRVQQLHGCSVNTLHMRESIAAPAAANAGDKMGTPSRDGMRGRRKASSRGHHKFVGVRQRPSGRWVAEIKDSLQKVRLWLGTFDTAEDAARAYDDAARALRGANARTNFDLPQSASKGGVGGGNNSCVPENAEPFSFDKVCGTEETDGLLGALRAKLIEYEDKGLPLPPLQAHNNSNKRERSAPTMGPPLVPRSNQCCNDLGANKVDHVLVNHDNLSHVGVGASDQVGMQWSRNGQTEATASLVWPTEQLPEVSWVSQMDPVAVTTTGGTWPLLGTGTTQATVDWSYSGNCLGDMAVNKNGKLDAVSMPARGFQAYGSTGGVWSSDQPITYCENNNWSSGGGVNASWDPLYVNSVLG
ncbi:hypothetical protein F0562_001276 [Nyssa sinensis]|uniref:AP2/ERF domain-containing protein n=1 Tax=Nyssa sinensis TaxID=561372 RepID=A0A5J5C421_9ASTE|nr:hypothetical protein F0562_001276 [Nyssa sinensis]